MKRTLMVVFIGIFIGGLIQAGYSQRKELNEKRTYFAKTYLNDDGSYSAVISSGPIHYRTEKGEFKEINREIGAAKAKDYTFEVTEGLYHAFFKSNNKAQYPVAFETPGGAKLEFGLVALAYMDDVSKTYHIIEESKLVVPKAENNVISFKNLFNHADLTYIYHDTRIEEILVFSQKAREALPDPKNYNLDRKNTYLMVLSRLNLAATLPAYTANNELIANQPVETYDIVAFKSLNDEVKFYLPSDFAYVLKNVKGDSLETLTSQIMKRRFFTDKGEHYLLSGVPLTWIDAQPQGAICFDPQIKITFQPDGAQGKDTWICSASVYQNKNAGASYRLQVENTTNKWRSLIKFAELESYIPPGAIIETAVCSLKCYYGSCGNYLELHRLNHSWLEGNGASFNGDVNNSTINGVTWLERWFGNNANDGNTPFNNADPDWQTLGGDYDSNIIDGLKSASSGNWTVWNVTALVQSWLNQTYENHGMILLRNDSQSNYVRFNSAECGTATERPKLYVKYQLTVPLTTYYIRDAAGNVIAIYKK